MRSAATLLGLAFVLVWCTGYIAGKLAVAEAGPLSTLVLRFGIAAALLALLAWLGRASWGSWREMGHSAVVGCLQLAMQFGGMYLSFKAGASAGVAALFTGLMPIAVALMAGIIGSERLGRAQWLGLGLGFAGVAMVVADRVEAGMPLLAWVALSVSLLGVSLGTLYQKRHASLIDLRAGLALQHLSAFLLLLPATLLLEGLHLPLTADFHLPLAWLVLVNSLGGFGLLFVLIRRGAATHVASLFFLMPPVTAAMGWVWLGEHFTWLKAGGFVVTAYGVWLATRTPGREQRNAAAPS